MPNERFNPTCAASGLGVVVNSLVRHSRLTWASGSGGGQRMFGWFRKRQPLFLGKWCLLQANGQPPSGLGILSMQLCIAPDGTLRWDMSMLGQWEGTTMSGDGRWFVDGNRLTTTCGEHTRTSLVRVIGSQLVLEPDFLLVRDGKVPVVGVYESAVEA
jgi:hypothetical protein